MLEIIRKCDQSVFMRTNDPEDIQSALLYLDTENYQVRMPDGKLKECASASWELDFFYAGRL